MRLARRLPAGCTMSWLVPLAAAAVAGHVLATEWLPPAAGFGGALVAAWAAFLLPDRRLCPPLLLAATAMLSAGTAALAPGRLESAPGLVSRPAVAEVRWRRDDGESALLGVAPGEGAAGLPGAAWPLVAPSRLHVGGLPDAAPGDEVLLPARVARAVAGRIDDASAPGGEAARPVAFGPTVRVSPGEVVRLAATRRGEPAWVAGARRHVERSLEARAPPVAARAARSMVLGQQWRLEGGERTALRDIGVSHLLAISGFNLAIVAWVLWRSLIAAASLWRPLLVRIDARRLAASVLLPSVWLVAAIVEWQPSVVRAALMISAFLAAQLLDRRATALDALALATVVAFVAMPAQVDDPGFQLSLAAVVGLLIGDRWGFGGGPAAAEPDEPQLPGARRPPLLRRIAAGVDRALLATGKAVLRLATASAFAVLATAPVTAARFGEVSPSAAAANLVAIPLFTATVYPPSVVLSLLAAGPAPDGVVTVAGAAAGVAWEFFVRVCRGLGAVLPTGVPVERDAAAGVALVVAAVA
ncbi:MAG: ComEC/Rec2 family competence protein, partial [Myxococcota bacterium]|nr:ComEC/Rec2 family competence protein [Myxococcota bacterium]